MIVATTLVTYDKPSCLTVEKKSVVWRKKKKRKLVFVEHTLLCYVAVMAAGVLTNFPLLLSTKGTFGLMFVLKSFVCCISIWGGRGPLQSSLVLNTVNVQASIPV